MQFLFRDRACAATTLLLLWLAFVPREARAALPDEIQVYLDDLNDPGRFGLQLHVNTTPVGVSESGYPGETVAAHGVRMTPEPSYGLTPDLEAGAYLPLVYSSSGELRLAGIKVRLKWVPIKQADGAPGIFAGLNGELSQVQSRFEQDQRAFEFRPILGWRDDNWLLAVNPVIDIALSGQDRKDAPDFLPSFKIARTVAPGIATGIEYYTDLGSITRLEGWSGQQDTLYWAIDINRKPWNINFGIGRGLTPSTDRWTVKMIVEIPLEY